MGTSKTRCKSLAGQQREKVEKEIKALKRRLQQCLNSESKTTEPEELGDLSVKEEIAKVLGELAVLQPNEPLIFYRLAMALMSTKPKQEKEAQEALEKHLQAWDDFEAAAKATGLTSTSDNKEIYIETWKVPQAKHWLAVAMGETTATAPPEYVAILFDGYAHKFEEHLVTQLQYRTPEMLAQSLQEVAGDCIKIWGRCADLGCGTGLMGPPLRELGFKGRLEGVDLSEGMLLKAFDKGTSGVGYDRLLCGDCVDIFTPLRRTSESDHADLRIERPSSELRTELPPDDSRFDLVLAADVFVYIGDLTALFRLTSHWLTRSGIFAFSTEALDENAPADFLLTSTGRYCHKPSYVQRLAGAVGLDVCACHPGILRMNADQPVHGHIHLLRPSSV